MIRFMAGCVLAAALVCGLPAAASPPDFVIDDFDDFVPRVERTSSSTPSPQRVTTQIAVSGATRNLDILALQFEEPDAFFDVGETRPSALTAEVSRLNTSRPDPIVALRLFYDWPGGIVLDPAFDALLIDVHELSSNGPIREVGVGLTDSANIALYEIRARNFVPRPDGGTLVFPFEDFFVSRGPGRPEFDFTTILRADLLITPALFGGPAEPGLRVSIDRIRFGTIASVPEPTAAILAALGVAGLASRRGC